METHAVFGPNFVFFYLIEYIIPIFLDISVQGGKVHEVIPM